MRALCESFPSQDTGSAAEARSAGSRPPQTQEAQGSGSAWCGEWRGISREEDAEVVEQLCGCAGDDGAANSSEYCEVRRRQHHCVGAHWNWIVSGEVRDRGAGGPSR